VPTSTRPTTAWRIHDWRDDDPICLRRGRLAGEKTAGDGTTTYTLRGPGGHLLSDWTVTGPTTSSVRDYIYAGDRLIAAATRHGGGPPGGGGGLPAGWSGADVGTVGVAGSASQAGGTFTVSGSGADIWGTADGFHFVATQLSGDGSIVARVATLQGADPWTKAGVMMRESLAEGSRHAFSLITTGNGEAFQRRTTTDDVSLHTAGGSGTAPRWVRLTREGTTVSAYASEDGTAWTLIGSDTIAMATTIYVGLAVTSHDNGASAVATFDGVNVTTGPWTGLPSGWTSSDVGSVGIAGSASYAAGTFTVSGSGADIWGTADGFRYVYRTLTGDGSITARVASLQGADPWTKAGVMIRESLAAGSKHAFSLITTGNGVAFQRRTATDDVSTHTGGPGGTAPQWVRLVRTGNTISAYSSTNGTTWTLLGTDTIGMTSTVYVGLAVTSHDNGAAATATFDNVVVP
jgi:regulation of enolase protein 1 (concanavalin A-like superfamily)